MGIKSNFNAHYFTKRSLSFYNFSSIGYKPDMEQTDILSTRIFCFPGCQM